jgi:hypothetical protein
MQVAPRYLPAFFISGGIPQINWEHPITQNLAGLWVPGIAQFNFVKGTQLAIMDTTNIGFRASPYGTAYALNGANLSLGFQSLDVPYLAKSGGVNWTIWGIAELNNSIPGGLVNGASLYGERGSSGNDIIKLDFSYSSAAFDNMEIVLRDDAGTLLKVNTAVDGSRDGMFHSWAGTKIGNGGSNNVTLWKDGQIHAQGSWTGVDSYTDATLTSTIGYDIFDTSGNWPGMIAIVGVWTRALNQSEILLLQNDPFCMLYLPEEFIAATINGFLFNLMPQILW